MGGLSCAAVLSRLGKRVVVLEQHHDVAGGGSHSFDIKGFRFDSGLHYTVPWSVPIFALTCLKKPEQVCQFDLMGEEDGTIDKIYLSDPSDSSVESSSLTPFKMQYKEKHLSKLYDLFPEEKMAIDEYLKQSDYAMTYVKIFIALRLFPKWFQEFCWRYIVPTCYTKVASVTAKELLPTLTSNKRLISLLSSMWIDTGARPDKASFMLTASVFRGISMEGGCYPVEGSESLAKELVSVIKNNGGSVFIRAPVKEILVENGIAVGVKMLDAANTTIRCKEAVVSSAGYVNTFKNLLPAKVTEKYDIPKELNVSQSAGFVMCNIGINASAESIGVTNTNTWHIPVTSDGDCFSPLETYFESPISNDTRMPAFITFPSTKDKKWSEKNPNKVSCQMLLMANYSWFEQYFVSRNDMTRKEGYNELKEIWKEKCLSIFLKYFPKAKGKIELVDISTPLTIENYLYAENGAAVGIDVTPQRFTDPCVRQRLDIVTDIPRLFLTGQDTVLCGVTLAQLSGVITAIRMTGVCSGLYILLQSLLLN
jgi:all-trans-retinol 13,14-reductase